MKKACRYCGKVHSQGHKCSQMPVKTKRTTEFDSFRSSYAWQKKRDAIKKRDNFCCRICFLNIFNQKINDFDTDVHHIVPLSEDYSKRLDEDNLITLCRAHHEAAENGIISRAELIQAIPPVQW